MKKVLFIFIASLLLFTSCTQRGCQSFNRRFQYSSRTYNVKVYSGGQIVFEDNFTGIVNQEESSDGIFYTKDGKLIEISGDYILTSTDN